MGQGPHRTIEQKGCQLWLLPSYSPDLNPIEEALSKVKNLIRKAKARTLQALFAVTGRPLEAVSEEDVRGFFDDCGYEGSRGHSLWKLLYSPKCVENEFCELRLDGVLRSSGAGG